MFNFGGVVVFADTSISGMRRSQTPSHVPDCESARTKRVGRLLVIGSY